MYFQFHLLHLVSYFFFLTFTEQKKLILKLENNINNGHKKKTKNIESKKLNIFS